MVQVVGPSVVNIMEETSSYHGHDLQISVIALQHSRLSTQRCKVVQTREKKGNIRVPSRILIASVVKSVENTLKAKYR